MRHMKTFAAIAALSMVASAAAADGARVVAALYGEPDSIDPIFDTNLPALNIYYALFDRLATIDAKGDVAPNMAKSWSHDADLTEWTFELNEGMTCHDGAPMDSADVVFTFNTAMGDKTSRLGGYMGLVESVSAPSPTTVTFKLKSAFAPWDRQVSLISVVCQEAYEKLGKEGFARHPVGSGPYKIVEWRAGDAIELARYDGYWNGAAPVESLIFKPVPDETTRASSVQSGDVDIALLGPSQAPAVKSGGAVDVIEQDANRVVYLGFNSAAPFLGDERVRKAIDLAINRGLISDNLLNGAVSPASQLIAPVTFGYDPSIAPTVADPEAAKALLAEAGYDGTPIKLSYPTTGLPQIDEVAQAVAYFMGEIGIKVVLDPQEQNTLLGNWFKSSLEGAWIFAFAPSVMDAHLPFHMLLKSKGQGYTFDDRIDALMVEQVGESDPVKRAADLSEISKIMRERTIYAPLFVDNYTYGVTKGLGWSPRPDGMMVFR